MRYLILIALNVPIVLLALLNGITQYKMHRVSKERFYRQTLLWLVIFTVLIGSFPVYNFATNQPIFDSISLSAFDIAQTTAIIFLFYVVNNQRRKIDQTERRLSDLHQELSIILSQDKHPR